MAKKSAPTSLSDYSAGDSLVTNSEALRHRAAQAPEPTPADLHTASEMKELIANVMFARTEFFKRFMEPDSRRNVAAECGYPEGVVDIETYQGLYDREPIPNRAMTLLPKECWQVTPEVYEDEDEENITPFEQAWQDIGKRVRGLRSWRKDERGSPVWEYLKRIDMQSGIGHFGLLLLGFDDVKTVRGGVGGGFGNQVPGQGYTGWGGVGASYGASTLLRPVPGVIEAQLETDPDKVATNLKKRRPGAVNLNFLRVYPESLVQILSYDQDRTSPRYGHPETYMITVADPREMPSQSTAPAYATENVHWTRVIHVADNLGSSEWSGVPRGQSILNRLLDTRKLYAASAEGFWQSCFAALSLETNPQLGGDVLIDKDQVRSMMADFRNGLQRYISLIGMSAKTLAPQVVDPSPQIERQIEAICVQLGCPVRIFKGSERGELASSQDDQAWNDRLKERQDGYITPRIIEPFVDRLIAAGALPPPEEGSEEEGGGGYKVKWPDLTSKSDQEKATVALTKTQAIAAYVSGGAEAVYPPQDFLTRIMGEDQKDAAAIIENANDHADEQKDEAQALADEHGMVPEAPPGFQHPPEPPPPPGPIKVKPGEKLVTPKPPPTTNEEGPAIGSLAVAVLTVNGWVTLEGGQHVFIGDDGKIEYGGPTKEKAQESKPASVPAGDQKYEDVVALHKKLTKENTSKILGGRVPKAEMTDLQKEDHEDAGIDIYRNGKLQWEAAEYAEQGSSYNEGLWAGGKAAAEARKDIDDHLSGFEKACKTPLKEPLTVYRGVQNDQFASILAAGKGGEVTFKGFTSTTLSKKAATSFGGDQHNSIIHITAKRGFYLGNAAPLQARELVQAPDTKYRLTHTSQESLKGKTYNVLHMEEV